MSPKLKLQLTDADPPELHAYVELQRLRNLSPRTIDQRTRLLRWLSTWLEKPLKDATIADLRRFVVRRGRRRVSRATHFTEITTLKTFYSALLERGFVEASPAEGLRCRRVRSTRQPISLGRVRTIFVEASEVQGDRTPRSLAVAKRDRACFELLFATGMRLSEASATLVVDVDLGDASVLVRRAKRGKPRRLPLPPSAVKAFRRYLDQGRDALLSDNDDQGRLFLNTKGRPLGRAGLYEVVRRVSKRCGAPTFPHAFRRTLATELAPNGASLPVIQEVLGHAQLTTTASYVETGVMEMREAIDLLDRQRPKGHAEPALLLNLQSRMFLGWQFQATSGSNPDSAADADNTGRCRRVA